jgi:serine/threonine protein kinase
MSPRNESGANKPTTRAAGDVADARTTPLGGADATTTPLSPGAPASAATPPTESAGLAPLAPRYEILGELGRGGMGIVYKAKDRETGDVVALKILLPEIAVRADLVDRFKSELVLARKVTHANVCRVHEFLRFETSAVISMEFLEGESLRRILKRYGPLSARTSLAWARQICAGIAAAHAQGVVHRDLKPENILVQGDDTVKVMDFGLARSVETGTTRMGSIMGTPAYMSPEQAEGKPADSRSDIYSLGLILYEMFTGQPAFQADSAVALLAKRVTETPAPPASIDPYLPPFIARTIEKCLQKDPAARFQSAAEVGAALSGRGDIAPPPEPARRQALRLAAAGIAAVVLLVAGYLAMRSGSARGVGHSSEITCVAVSPDGHTAASATEDKIIKLWDVVTQKELRTLVGHTRAVNSVAFSPDGRSLVSASADKTVRLWNVAGNEKRAPLVGHTRSVDSAAFSPDGRWIASGGDDGVVILWEAASGRKVRTLTGHSSEVNSVTFAPNSRLLASASEDETVRLWDPLSGRNERELKGHEDSVQVVAFSRDGAWLASGSYDGALKIWEVSTGNVLQNISAAKGWVRAAAFSPDSKWVASGGEDGIVKIWEIATGKELRRFNGHTDGVTSLAISADGKLLVSGSLDGSIRFWRLSL